MLQGFIDLVIVIFILQALKPLPTKMAARSKTNTVFYRSYKWIQISNSTGDNVLSVFVLSSVSRQAS